jgi:hypothetical protein
MTQTTTSTFDRDSLTRLRDAQSLISDFEAFLLTRFAAYTRYTTVTSDRGVEVDPIEDPFERTNAGYGYFRVPTGWLNILFAITDADGMPTNGSVVIEHYIADDRGPGTTRKYSMPLSFVFGEEEREAERAEFLRLKSIFEPDTDTGVSAEAAQQRVEQSAEQSAEQQAPASASEVWSNATDKVPPAPAAAAEALDPEGTFDAEEEGNSYAHQKERQAAARVLLVESENSNRVQSTFFRERVAALADPANRDDAAAAYRKAMTNLTRPGLTGTSQARRRVHAAALTLDLTAEDLRSLTVAAPKPDPIPEASSTDDLTPREAARILLIEAGLNRFLSHSDSERHAAHLSKPQHKAEAAAAYRMALARLMSPGKQGTGEARERVHHAAQVLGLTDDDLRTPGTPGAAKPAEQTVTDLGYTLLNDLTGGIFGNTQTEARTPDMARRAYEKGRAVLTLSGKDVLGAHSDDVIAVLDDVADLLGLRKR